MWPRKFILLLLCIAGFYTGYAQKIIPAPKLECVYNEANGGVHIDWQPDSTACGGFVHYTLYYSTNRSGPYDSFPPITSKSIDTFLHAGANGNSVTWYYYIKATYNCPGYTSLSSDTFTNAPLPVPQLKAVTVVNGRVLIEWYPVKSPQVYDYVIYSVAHSTQKVYPITTIIAQDSTYLDITSKPDSTSYYYTIASQDSCGNTGNYNTNPQHTIYFNDTIHRCAHTMSLNWNAYDNWVAGVKKYYFYLGDNGTTPILADSFDNTTLNYFYPNLQFGDSLTYYIKAISGNGDTSISNVIRQRVRVFHPVTQLYIDAVAVLKDNTANITFSMNDTSTVATIILQTGIDSTHFLDGSTIGVPVSLNTENVYNDYLSYAGQQSVYYRLKTTDSCGGIAYSNVARTTFLDGYGLANLRNHLDWNNYTIGSQYGYMSFYNLYRKTSIDTLWHFIKMCYPDSVIYDDNIGQVGSPDGKFWYYLEGFDTCTIPYGFPQEVSYTTSNVLYIDQATRIYMPNVFEPNGRLTEQLKPKLVFTDIASYSFTIFNRYGQIVFSTNSPDGYWDGKFAGSIVQQDVYTYIINVIDHGNLKAQKTGTVLVLR